MRAIHLTMLDFIEDDRTRERGICIGDDESVVTGSEFDCFG